MADKTLPPVAIGDSLAVGMRDANKIPGLGRVGAGPREVLDMIKRFSAENSLSGRDVFIGTGMPNIPEQRKFIEEQIDFVRKQGGNPILMGVGPGTKAKPTTGQNEFLAGLAERKGLPYMGPLANRFPDITKDPMGLHLRASQYQQIFKQYSKPSQAQPQTQQVQPESRAPRSADLLSQFTGAVMQAESQGKRYDKSGKLLTSKAGAMGEMQVMPETFTKPGYGVRPARDNSPDEIARVGRDYAAVMLRRYNNDPTAAAVAYNWGPGNADKWVKRGADFNQLPRETQNYVTRITGQMGVPIAAKRAPAPSKKAEVRPVPPAKRAEVPPQKRAQVEEFAPGATLDSGPQPAEQQNVVTRSDVERLGPGYQAALAAMTLADSRDEDDDYFDDDETIAERYMERRAMEMAREESTLEEEEPMRSSPLAGLADISVQSPFAQREPIRMADGGEARAMLDDIEPTFGQKMGATLSDIATKGLINIYDAARLTEGALSSKESAAEKEQKMSAAHKIYLDTFGLRQRRDPVTAEYFNPEEQRAIADLIAKKGGKKGSIQYKDYGFEDRKIKPSNIVSGQLDPYVSVNKSLGQFNYEFDPKTNSYRVIDQYDFNPLVDVGGRQVSSDFMGDYLSEGRSLYNKARTYAGRKMPPGTGRRVDFTVPAPAPVKRAEGSPIYGEVATGGITPDTLAALRNAQGFNAREALAALRRIGREGVSNLESLARGSVAGVPGMVGDIESIFRDDKARRFATSEEVERQYLPKRMTAPTKESQGFVGIGTAIDPTIVLKAAKPTARAALAAMKASGPQIESALMKAAPAAQPMGIIPEARKMLMETPETSLFVSKVDDFIASQKGPVTKQQLLGQMKGKFRDYEIGRVSTALANYPDTAKFTPEYLSAAVQSSYPTSRLKTYVLEPQKVDRWSSSDNVYFDQPVGVVNLRFDTPMEDVYKAASSQEAIDKLSWLSNPTSFSTANKTAQDLVDLSGAIKNLPNADRYKKLTTELDNFYSTKVNIDDSLFKLEKAVAAYKYPATIDGWSNAINDFYKKTGNYKFEDAREYADKFVQKEADNVLKNLGVSVPSKSLEPEAFIKALESSGAKKTQSLSQLQQDELIKLNDKVRPEMEAVLNEFKKTSIYEGQHKSLTPKGSPVAFSRFVDHTVDLPGKGETKVMHMIELQSDLLDDIFKSGPKSGSKVKDLEELSKTQASIKALEESNPQLIDPMKKLDHLKSMYAGFAPAERSEAYRKIIQQNPELEKELMEYLKLRDRESKLNVRTRMGNYGIEEAFPGMEKSPQVVQQMMIKNAIGGAMQRGVNAVTFPGKESKQAQLYEKLYPNLKQAVKDLGPGFDIRQIELYDSLGNPYSHWGVVWDDSTANRILKTGIRFNKGGLVEKQDADDRKFI